MKSALSLLSCAAACRFSALSGVQVLNPDAHYPEGPIWYHGKLYYVEYDRNTVTAWDGRSNAVFSAEGLRPVRGDAHRAR